MINSIFEKVLQKNELLKTILLLFSLVGMMVLMRWINIPLKNEFAPAGIVSFELAKDIEKSTLILSSWGNEALNSAKKSMYYDFLFLCIYSTFIGLLIYKLNKKLNIEKPLLTEIILGSVFLAAFFDVIENIALLQLIYGNLEQVWSSMAYYFAMMKFIILAIAIVYVLVGSMLVLYKKI